MLKMLYADEQGNIYDAKKYQAMAMVGRNNWRALQTADVIEMPRGADIMFLPKRQPLGWRDNCHMLLEDGQAVAVTLPIGYTRTMLPAYESRANAPQLPFYGYTAVGYDKGKFWVAALKTSSTKQWQTDKFNTPDLAGRIKAKKRAFVGNRIVEHLANCAQKWHCPTAQNFFYNRWEMGLPTTQACNANCLGCISQQAAECCPAPQSRIEFVPMLDEIVNVAVAHLQQADKPIVSFGQGCEGDPLLSADLLAAAIVEIRRQTKRGLININSNAGYTIGLEKVLKAGLDSLRVSIISAKPDTYQAYYRANYSLVDVENSLHLCQKHGIDVSLNFLLLPGCNDLASEFVAWQEFLRRNPVQMIQLRNLNIDTEYFWREINLSRERCLGVNNMLSLFKKEFPLLRWGNFTVFNQG